jgi:hypothetical protein
MEISNETTLKAACIQAAATVFASGKLNQFYSATPATPDHVADNIARFAAALYRTWRDYQTFDLDH